MSQPDVADLSRETLAQGTFPIERREPFRVSLAERVHAGVQQHASENASVEICGVLVGEWKTDADGPFAVVTEYIRCDTAAQKFAEVTFTHESWAQINREMDTRYQNLRIIGWYHSHPNFGIFLSDRDTFIQQHFFSGPGQIAYVVDPVRKTEGIFEWRSGKPALMHHYWVGNRVRLGDSADARPESGMAAQSPASSREAEPAGSWNSLSSMTSLILVVCMFLLGYLLRGRQSDWERQRLAEGVVAHYGLWTGLRPGLEENLAALDQHTLAVAQETKKLAEEHAAAAGEKGGTVREQWQKVTQGLDQSRRALREMKVAYGMSEEERDVLRRIIAEKQRELLDAGAAPRKGSTESDRTESDRKKPASDEGKPAAEKTAPEKPARDKPAVEKSASEKPPPAQRKDESATNGDSKTPRRESSPERADQEKTVPPSKPASE